MPSDRRAVVDSAGREVVLSGRPRRIFPTGNAAAAAVWHLSPAALLGWPAARRGEAPLLAVTHDSVPRIARADPDAAVAAQGASGTDLVVDFGNAAASCAAFADLAQRETGILAAAVDGRLVRTDEALALLGRLPGLAARAETLAAERASARRAVARAVRAVRPRVRNAIGPRGERVAQRGSIRIAPLGLVGAVAAPCIAAGAPSRLAIDPAVAVAADPDLIVTTDSRFHAGAVGGPRCGARGAGLSRAY